MHLPTCLHTFEATALKYGPLCCLGTVKVSPKVWIIAQANLSRVDTRSIKQHIFPLSSPSSFTPINFNG